MIYRHKYFFTSHVTQTLENYFIPLDVLDIQRIYSSKINVEYFQPGEMHKSFSIESLSLEFDIQKLVSCILMTFQHSSPLWNGWSESNL